MNTTTTVIQVLLLIPLTIGGVSKLALPYARFAKLPFQAWANDFKPGHIRLIGILEVSAAVGIGVALFVDALSALTPLAAVGFALIMAGAMTTHLRRAEYVNLIGNMVWLGLALFLAYDRLVEL